MNKRRCHTILRMLCTLCIVGVLECCGCASLKFRVVDANSGQPLPKVRVSLFALSSDIILGSSTQIERTGTTDPKGVVVARFLDPKKSNTLEFSCDGYREARAYWSGDRVVLVISPSIGPLDPGGKGNRDAPINSPIIVRLFRQIP
jgi:hypothetical protein